MVRLVSYIPIFTARHISLDNINTTYHVIGSVLQWFIFTDLLLLLLVLLHRL